MERCYPAVSKRHRNTIWQETWPGKGKVWKLEQLRQQAWPGTWQKRVRQERRRREVLHTFAALLTVPKAAAEPLRDLKVS